MQVSGFARLAGVVVLAGAIGSAALAFADATDTIKARRALMKGNGEGAKVIGAMLDGSAPFVGAKAAAATADMAKAGHGFSADFAMNFPDGSQTGDTKASPDIWANKDDFIKRAAALETDATAAGAAAAKGMDAFQPAADKLFGNCKGCHEKYKLK